MGATQAQCNRSHRAGRYVLGELDARSRLAFERHLKVCGRCRDEVSLLMNAADALPLLSAKPQPPEADAAQPRHPSPALAALAGRNPRPAVEGPSLVGIPSLDEPSQRPRTDESELRREVYERRLETAALRSGWTPGAARQIAGGAFKRRRGPKVRLLQKPVPGPALVGFVAVAIVGILTVGLSGRIAGIRYERAKAGWSPGGAAIELAGNQLEVLVERMARPPAGTGYQIWVLRRATHELVPTTAWLRPDRAGSAGANVPGNYHAWAAVAVYVEHLHGHESTRSGAVVVADLRHVA